MWRIEKPLENRDGVLFMDGHDTVRLAEEYGTPLYAYSKKRIIENYSKLCGPFFKRHKKFKLHYAVKANSSIAILRILSKAGAGADCASPAEIFLALKAGFRPEDILYSGNYNSDEELEFACRNRVKMNLDDIQFIDRIVDLNRKKQAPLPSVVSFRLDPGAGEGKFEGLVTSGPDAKFGLVEEKIIEAYERARNHGFKRFGLHMMTGSCILDERHFESVTHTLFETAGLISSRVGVDFEFIDIGGGFGISYESGEKELNVDRLARGIARIYKAKTEEHGLGSPSLYIEPGRFIVGDAGILLTRVNSVKRAHKVFVGVDAGMNTLLRPALYGAYHRVCLANRLNSRAIERVDIVGQICESTDRLARDRLMPRIEKNDLLAVLNAGAYCYSMSSQYNGRPRPAEVLLGSRPEIIRERESFEDLLSGQRV